MSNSNNESIAFFAVIMLFLGFFAGVIFSNTIMNDVPDYHTYNSTVELLNKAELYCLSHESTPETFTAKAVVCENGIQIFYANMD